jgi:hypothetical protein
MLVACRLAGLSGLEGTMQASANTEPTSRNRTARFTDLTASGRMSNIAFARAVANGVKLGRKPTLKSAA